MDDFRFDRLTKSLARGTSRRTIVKAALGLGGAAMVGELAFGDAEGARRPTPTPKPSPTPLCSGGIACGPDCCRNGAVCCDNACCNGQCYGEELCCPTGNHVCDGVACCQPNEICMAGRCVIPSATPPPTQPPTQTSVPTQPPTATATPGCTQNSDCGVPFCEDDFILTPTCLTGISTCYNQQTNFCFEGGCNPNTNPVSCNPAP